MHYDKNWKAISTIYLQKIFVLYLTDASYPLWRGIAVWPVNNFVKANDFARKTVISFCTSVLSGLGEKEELLAKLAGSGEWKEGIRFLSNASDEEVRWNDWEAVFIYEGDGIAGEIHRLQGKKSLKK